ncbi:haus augmin-like complex subunit 2 [Trifolium medium]|uniref:Haus augmin-like complex subunit 2 n=1 Tax=Trifolium medium TaxID=97028 RepID=A0A392P0F2_9FABA|nr:haus augmin-like complex subunit 2 [Trifolium medium]
MLMSSKSSWVRRKPVKRIGGMSNALSIATHLGFSVSTPSPQVGLQNSSLATREKDDDLIEVLRELITVQRKIADLQVELRGRKVSLTHSGFMCILVFHSLVSL